MGMKKIVLLNQEVESKVFVIRGQRVMLDRDLAELYAVSTKRFNEQVRRNISRFPEDFMFQLTEEEDHILRSQIATSSWGGRRYLPFTFTEQGIAMLSSVLNSERAIQVNIAIMRTFVRLKQTLWLNKELAYKFRELEDRVSVHDQEIQSIFKAIRRLMAPPKSKPKGKWGFT